MTDLSFDRLQNASVDGTQLAYHESGQGDPVILVHGTASDIRTWSQQISSLSDSHRVIAYSRRYARPNNDIPDGMDDQMLPHVEDLRSFQQAVDAQPAHLVGHSWGGFVCLLAAIHHPDSVKSLVVLEPPVVSLFVSTPPKPAELATLMVKRPTTATAIISLGRGLESAEKAFRHGDDNEAMQIFGRTVLGEEWFERLAEDRMQQSFDNAKSAKAQMLGDGFPPLSDDQVKNVSTPTLLLEAEDSPSAFHKLLDRLEELMPNTQRVKIPNASHIMNEDNPGAVNEAVKGFLKTVQ